MAKILLVEDDNNLRDIYGERLMAEGYDIISASDGEEALQTAVTQKPDLIISDVMMPKISGFDMLDILRQTPETKNIKIIMMTALSQAEDKSRADKLGADKYLVKSQVTLEDVARVVHDVLGDQPEDETPEPAQETDVNANPEAIQSAPSPELEVTNPVVPIAPEPVTPQTVQEVVPEPQPVQNTSNQAAQITQPDNVQVQPVQVVDNVSNTAIANEPASGPQITPAQSMVQQIPITQLMQDSSAQPEQPQSPATVPAPAVTQPPAAQPNPTADQTNTAPVTNPISGAPSDAAPALSNVITSTTEEEISEVAKQISNFVNSNPPVAEHTEPANDPTEQDLIHAQNANEDPKIVTANLATNVSDVAPTTNIASPTDEQALAPNPFLNNDPSVPNYSVNNPEPVSNRKKIISPINNLESPDIHALYEQEMATEAASSPVAQNYPTVADNPEPPVLQTTSPAPLAAVTHNVPSANDMADQTINPITVAQQPVLRQVATDLPPELETLDISTVTGITENPEISFEESAVTQASPIPNQPVQPQDVANATPQPTAPESTDLNNPANFAL